MFLFLPSLNKQTNKAPKFDSILARRWKQQQQKKRYSNRLISAGGSTTRGWAVALEPSRRAMGTGRCGGCCPSLHLPTPPCTLSLCLYKNFYPGLNYLRHDLFGKSSWRHFIKKKKLSLPRINPSYICSADSCNINTSSMDWSQCRPKGSGPWDQIPSRIGAEEQRQLALACQPHSLQGNASRGAGAGEGKGTAVGCRPAREGESFHGDKKSKSWVSCFKAEMRTLPKREQLVGITRDDGATPAALCN